MKVRNAAVAMLCLLSQGLQAEEAALPGEKRMNEFDREVARALYSVVPPAQSGPQSFVLIPQTIAHSGNVPVTPGLFVFHGAGMNPVRIECERGTILRVLAFSSVESAISVGDCSSRMAEVKAMLKQAPSGLEAARAYFRSMPGAADDGAITKAGLYFSERDLGNGVKRYYVPVVFMTLGAVVMETVVLVDEKSAWIVLAQLGTLCGKGSGSASARSDHRLCANTEQVLGEMAMQLRSRLSPTL